jgi:hypothetical protein
MALGQIDFAKLATRRAGLYHKVELTLYHRLLWQVAHREVETNDLGDVPPMYKLFEEVVRASAMDALRRDVSKAGKAGDGKAKPMKIKDVMANAANERLDPRGLYVGLRECCGSLINLRTLEELFKLVAEGAGDVAPGIGYKQFETLIMTFEVLY